jgi:hypothetical protein
MNCSEFTEDKFRAGYISPKIDGVRGFYLPWSKTIVSRDQKTLIGLDHIERAFGDYPYVSDMELAIPGMEFNQMSGLIRNHNPVPEVVAHIIDTPGLDCVPIKARLLARVESNDVLLRIPHYPVKTLKAFYDWHKKFLQQGYEGSVWKAPNEVYWSTRKWLRLVPINKADVQITGSYEGKGKFANMLGGFYFSFNGYDDCKVGTLKGITMEDRQLIWDNKDTFIGKWMELCYKELQPSGMMRQPRFKWFRHDKG